jgi:hypothetical protein
MTAQDYITIYWEAQSAGLSAVTLYISILSGYLIVFMLLARSSVLCSPSL